MGEQARERIKDQGKDFLLSASDTVLETLEKVLAKVEESEDLDADAQAELIADLESQIQEIEDAKAVTPFFVRAGADFLSISAGVYGGYPGHGSWRRQ